MFVYHPDVIREAAVAKHERLLVEAGQRAKLGRAKAGETGVPLETAQPAPLLSHAMPGKSAC